MNYNNYLKSEHWKKTRKTFWKKIGKKRCFICHTKKEILDVHHKRYDNIGDEKHTDLRLLCRTCHKKIHKHNLEDYLKNNKIKRSVLNKWMKTI